MTTAPTSKSKPLTFDDPAGVDMLVLSTVNAPYRRSISATTLAECLASAALGDWPVHVATFFTDVNPELIVRFAEVHGISESKLAQAYRATRSETGEYNLQFEARLA